MDRVKEVHATEVFRALQNACQFANRNGRGIGRQNRIRAHFLFRFCQYRFFHFRVFDDRFNDDVHAVKTGVLQRWLNG
ncbi:hypothetical protein D3C71_2135490 [compost metagenome]